MPMSQEEREACAAAQRRREQWMVEVDQRFEAMLARRRMQESYLNLFREAGEVAEPERWDANTPR
jgi:hypothetical protein